MTKSSGKILILGAGIVGANVVSQLVRLRPEFDLRIGDINEEGAQRVAKEYGENIEAVCVDVHNESSLDKALVGIDIIVNTVGPFYRHMRPVVEGAIRNKVDYVDVNDDYPPARDVLEDKDLRAKAEEAGVRIVTGCGMAPGFSNVVIRHMIDQLETPKRAYVNILMPISIVASFTPAVLDHMLVGADEITKYKNGEYVKGPGYSEEFSLNALPPFRKHSVFNVNHGEVPMIANAFPELEEVAVRNGYFDENWEDANEKWAILGDIGLSSTEKLSDIDKSPIDVLGAMNAENRLDKFFGLDKIESFDAAHLYEVEGIKDGREVSIRTQAHAGAYGENEDDTASTGGRVGCELILDDKVTDVGILTPEVAFNPEEFIKRFAENHENTLKITQETVVLGDYPNPTL